MAARAAMSPGVSVIQTLLYLYVSIRDHVKKLSNFPTIFEDFTKDGGNGVGLHRVECLGTQNRNPNLKPESAMNTNSSENPSPKPKPADPRNPMDNPKPEFFFTN
jgi:hypothetical protein